MSNDVTALQPDRELENADFCKTTWDLPPWGSALLREMYESWGLTEAGFKRLPVYLSAVERGIIGADGSWRGTPEGYGS
jgi:hypothetical protein